MNEENIRLAYVHIPTFYNAHKTNTTQETKNETREWTHEENIFALKISSFTLIGFLIFLAIYQIIERKFIYK